MSNFYIFIIVVAVLIIIFLTGRRRKMDSVKSKRFKTIKQRRSWADEAVMSPEQVEEKLQSLLSLIEEEIVPTQPLRAGLLKEIVKEWAELKKHIFEDRRSWVRKPDEEGES